MRYDAWDLESWVALDPERAGRRGRGRGRRRRAARRHGAGHRVDSVRRRATLTYVLRAGSPRLDIDIELDWQHEEHLLSMAFPLDVHADVADVRHPVRCRAPARPTPRPRGTPPSSRSAPTGTSTWPSPSFGVAVLNDGRYGHCAVRRRGAGQPGPRRPLPRPGTRPGPPRRDAQRCSRTGPVSPTSSPRRSASTSPVRRGAAVVAGPAPTRAPIVARDRSRGGGRRRQARRRRRRRPDRAPARGGRRPGAGHACASTGGSPPRQRATCSRSRTPESRSSDGIVALTAAPVRARDAAPHSP